MTCCNNTIKITSVTTGTSEVVLIPARTITQTNLTDMGRYQLIIGCGLKATSSLPVYIQTSVGNIPLLSKYANQVYANQLRTRHQYYIAFGNENSSYTNGQFVLLNNLCCLACNTSVTETE
jgi:hypothetical protein